MYLPYCSDDNLDVFCYYLVKLDDLIKDFTTPYVYIIGDFNADTMTGKQQKFGKELMDFCHGEELILSDVKKCPNTTCTYVYTTLFLGLTM